MGLSVADGLEPDRVPGDHGLFDELDLERLHALEGVDGLWDRPALVGVDPEADVGPDGLADGLDPGDILVGVQPDLGLEVLVAVGRMLLRFGGHDLGRVDARR